MRGKLTVFSRGTAVSRGAARPRGGSYANSPLKSVINV